MYQLHPHVIEALHADRRQRLLREAGDARLRRERWGRRRLVLHWPPWPARAIERSQVAHQRA